MHRNSIPASLSLSFRGNSCRSGGFCEGLLKGIVETLGWRRRSSFNLRGRVGGQFRLDGGDFFPDGLQGAASVRGSRGGFLRGVLLLAPALVRLHEGLSALGFDELHAELGRHHGGHLLVGFPDAVGEGGDAALLEVLVHEGVHDGIVEAVEEADGLDDGDDRVDGHAVVLILQIIWKRRDTHHEGASQSSSEGSWRLLTVLEQHVDRVERGPADGEQQNDGDHHFDGSFLFPFDDKRAKPV